MGAGLEEKETAPMKCHVCGAEMEPTMTDLPFKTHPTTIIIVKNLPVLQCKGCREYLLEDRVMEKLELLLGRTDDSTELEILKYAA
jgi:YgiT-type zinc finger domain-containing protein